MKTLDGAKLTFDKRGLTGFTDGELQCMYVFPQILNRLKMLDGQVFGHWAVALDLSRPAAVRDAALCGVIESIFLTAGELKEAWEAIQQCFYARQVSKTMHPLLPADVQGKLKRLPEYFKGTSLTTFLRNNFSYHNSPDAVLASIKLLDEDDPHTAYLLPQENNYFDYATKVRLATVAEHLKLSDRNTVVDEMLKIVVKEVLTDVSNVLNAILAMLFQKVAVKNEALSLAEVKSESELTADFFFYVDPRS